MSSFMGRAMYYILPLNRYLIYRILSCMENSGYREKERLWRAVWKNREYWIDGWTERATKAVRHHSTIVRQQE